MEHAHFITNVTDAETLGSYHKVKHILRLLHVNTTFTSRAGVGSIFSPGV